VANDTAKLIDVNSVTDVHSFIHSFVQMHETIYKQVNNKSSDI